MTPAPAPPEAPAARPNRVVADLSDDLARRLRTWAGMRGQPVSHVVCELIRQAVPTADQLAQDLCEGGAGNGYDH
jgi:hypothetical protein